MPVVIGVPNPNAALVLQQRSRVTLGTNPDRLKRSRRSFYLFFAFDVCLYLYGLAAVVERKRVGRPRL